MHVSFVNNTTYSGVSGLSRYERSLFQAFREYPCLDIYKEKIPPPALPPEILWLIKRAGFDLVTFHENYPLRWPKGLSGLVHLTRHGQATLLTRKRKIPIVVTVHDIIHYKYRNDPSMHIYRNPVQKWFDAMAVHQLKKADAILAVSQYTRQCLVDLADIPPENIQVIYEGINPDQFHPLEVPPAFFQHYGINHQIPYILHISTEEPRKNFPRVIESFAKVKRQMPEVGMLKIGRPLYPEQREHHHKLIETLGIQDGIQFFDEVSDEDLPYFYNISSLLLFPSLEEGFGFPVLEAMACGLPVICSGLASLPEIAGGAALFVNPFKTEEIVESVFRLLNNKELSTQLSIAGITQAKLFSWQRTASQTLEVYQKVLESHDAA
jgi:glycosyltransferase involved in cell wall biosynthesis